MLSESKIMYIFQVCKRITTIMILTAGCFLISNAQENLTVSQNLIPLSGTLPPKITNEGKPYLVTAPIDIPEGSHTTIEEGTILLFKNFTGLSVNGILVVEGASEMPVVFTSENDTLYNTDAALEPAPFDWDGIIVNPGQKNSVFDYCEIKYSLFGIKCESGNISIKECVFQDNGNADISIKGVVQEIGKSTFNYISDQEYTNTTIAVVDTVSAGDLYSINEENATKNDKEVVNVTQYNDESSVKEKSLDLNTPEDKTEEKSISYEKSSSKPKKGGKIALRLVSFAAVVAGGTYGVVEMTGYGDARDTFDEIDNYDGMKYSSQDWNDAKNEVNDHVPLIVTGFGIALAGLTLFSISFGF